MSDLPNRIREIRKARGLTLKALASQIGASHQQIARLEKGERELTVWWMQQIAPALGCQPANLLPQPNVEPGPPLQHLPLISWVRAGEWTGIEDPHEPGTYERLVPVTRRYSNRAFALRIVGDSMSAPDGGDSFPDGSIIAVEPMQEARNGSYVVVRTEGANEATFKQLVIDGDRTFLKPRNPRYPIVEVGEEATICGVVRQMVMDFDK